ncbi:DedA family protein [Actinosynnema sp. CS-041913]|uniref:DedA family protein n=1 Tax=Actinosynnema sp. CS-041913 TaxID=3239917 RepID=UPI003D8E0597
MTALLVLFVVAAVPLAPTEAVLIGCGVLAASGELPLAGVILVAAVGCFVADIVNYSLGRSAGMRALRRFSRKPGSRAVVEWTASKLASRGEPILVAVRWVPGGGLVGALLAGSLRWPSRRFAPVALAGATLWSGYTALIGYFGGQVVDDPLVAIALSWGVAMLISVPVGMAVKAAQRKVVVTAAG